MEDSILARFAQMAELTQEQAENWETLCADAEAELSPGLREEAGDGGALFRAACAALAFYRYSMLCACGGEESFSAGEIRVTRGPGGVKAAERLWLSARRAAAPVFRDDGFYFHRVRP